MAKTVVALFEDKDASKRAVDELVQMGIPKNRVDISHGRPGDGEARGGNVGKKEKDGISRFFENLFGSNDDSERYSHAARSSNCIVTVHVSSQEEATKAAAILDRAGAEDIDELSSGYREYNAGNQGHADQATGAMGTGRSDATSGSRENDRTIPVINEDVTIGKREVETGGVRVRSRIVERPVEETLRLREEHVRVERRKVDRSLNEQDRQHFKDGTTEFVERKEVPVVNKQTRVVEEIHMSKQVNERQEKIRDTEKKTEVDVEKLHRGQGNDLTSKDRKPGEDRRPGDDLGRSGGIGNDPRRK